MPGEDPDAFVERLRSLVDDDGIEFTVLMRYPPSSSPVDTALYRAIEQVAATENLRVLPEVLRGFTDSHFFRDLGIVCYGFSPFLIPSQDFAGVHGNDERIPVRSYRDGVRLLYNIVRRLCASQPQA